MTFVHFLLQQNFFALARGIALSCGFLHGGDPTLLSTRLLFHTLVL